MNSEDTTTNDPTYQKHYQQVLENIKLSLLNIPPGKSSKLDHNFKHSATSRILDIHFSSKNHWQVVINSNDLSLDQKIFLEKHLIKNLPQNLLKDQKISIYFKRLKQKTPIKKSFSLTNLNLKTPDKPQKIPNVKKTLAIYSAKGGVGKSTISALIAHALNHKNKKTGILDADIYGPSIPSLFGISEKDIKIEDNKIKPANSLSIECMSFGLLCQNQTAVQWRGPMISKAIYQMCFDVTWNSLDWLVFDMPPGTGDIQLTLFDKVHFDAVIIITTAQDLALLDTKRTINLLAHKDLPIMGIVENMAHHSCHNCGEILDVFGKLDAKDFLRDHGYEKISSIPFDANLIKYTKPLSYKLVSETVKQSINPILDKLL